MLTNTDNNVITSDEIKIPATKHLPLWLSNFVNVYQQLSTDNLSLLTSIYHPNVTFVDPIHQVEGIDELHHYFEKLYQNLSSCQFEIDDIVYDGEQAAIYWCMTYQHTRLNKGKVVSVVGNSHLKVYEDKVIYHRDHLDLGAMLYEQLPVVGKLIKWLKAKAAQ